MTRDHPEVEAELAPIDGLMDEIISDTRGLTADLGTPLLYELGLAEALQSLVRRFEEIHGIPARFEDDERDKPLDENARRVLYQAVRELLHNIVKHAEAEHVVVRLQRDGRTVAFAESCTGGLLAARLTDVAGSSSAMLGGVVAYSDAAKQALLDVPGELLRAHGAVSEPVAAAMAAGARARFGADCAFATTGIAGPSGGSEGKPVGTVCFGRADAAGAKAWTVRIPDLGRVFVRDRAVFEVWRELLR
ncbi:MAG: nicotinamide-nucleotide amidohydrolase family protein [Planctomycetes bacterium]|nr:nicotinamide-nucleotide amidohydrolase family protein [Planctomycetota bacterium]